MLRARQQEQPLLEVPILAAAELELYPRGPEEHQMRTPCLVMGRNQATRDPLLARVDCTGHCSFFAVSFRLGEHLCAEQLFEDSGPPSTRRGSRAFWARRASRHRLWLDRPLISTRLWIKTVRTIFAEAPK